MRMLVRHLGHASSFSPQAAQTQQCPHGTSTWLLGCSQHTTHSPMAAAGLSCGATEVAAQLTPQAAAAVLAGADGGSGVGGRRGAAGVLVHEPLD